MTGERQTFKVPPQRKFPRVPLQRQPVAAEELGSAVAPGSGLGVRPRSSKLLVKLFIDPTDPGRLSLQRGQKQDLLLRDHLEVGVLPPDSVRIWVFDTLAEARAAANAIGVFAEEGVWYETSEAPTGEGVLLILDEHYDYSGILVEDERCSGVASHAREPGIVGSWELDGAAVARTERYCGTQ